MSRKQRYHNDEQPFQVVNDAARLTGLSTEYLRYRLNTRSIPFIKVGNNYYINMPMLLEQLNRESMQDDLTKK